METEALLTFLGLVALGSYVQTVSGFAIAMVIIGGATVLGLAPIAFTANVVSFVAMANILVAVHRLHSHIDRKIMLFGSTGVLLLTAAGLWLLNHLSVAAVDLLETLLGIVILASGAILVIRPHPRTQVSGNAAHLLAGGVGGLLNGMFGAGGPAVMLHLYRQPLPFPVIRTTLLAILGTMLSVRLVLEGIAGHITIDVLKLSAICVPVAVIATVVARRFPPPVSETAMRRFAFGLLCAIGISLIVGNV